jgi:hypothetical protein
MMESVVLGEEAVLASHAPWNSCKFVAATIAHLTSHPRDAAKKLQAVACVSHSLGGMHLPSGFESSRRVDTLLREFESACRDVNDLPTGSALILSCSLTDVEIMQHPRAVATFAHSFTLAISRAGIAVFQGFGARGYTLRQFMLKSKIMTPSEAFDGIVAPVTVFLSESAESGMWTPLANEAYKRAFDVDLEAMGNMKRGRQLDAFIRIGRRDFTADDVRANLRLFPTYVGPSLRCRDDDIASGRVLSKFGSHDGGARHRYIPFFARICSASACQVASAAPVKRCTGCKIAFYCSTACQKSHWAEHKASCKRCAWVLAM